MEERSYSAALSPAAARSAKVRLVKIIGQLKTVARMLNESPRDIEALTQYASATAAVGSLMKLIANYRKGYCAFSNQKGSKRRQLGAVHLFTSVAAQRG